MGLHRARSFRGRRNWHRKTSDPSVCFQKPVQRWLSASRATTIAFPDGLSCLAPALEMVLILYVPSLPSLEKQGQPFRA